MLDQEHDDSSGDLTRKCTDDLRGNDWYASILKSCTEN